MANTRGTQGESAPARPETTSGIEGIRPELRPSAAQRDVPPLSQQRPFRLVAAAPALLLTLGPLLVGVALLQLLGPDSSSLLDRVARQRLPHGAWGWIGYSAGVSGHLAACVAAGYIALRRVQHLAWRAFCCVYGLTVIAALLALPSHGLVAYELTYDNYQNLIVLSGSIGSALHAIAS